MNARLRKSTMAAAVLCALATSTVLVADVEDQYGDWFLPISLLPPVNSTAVENAPFISRDGLSLYFHDFPTAKRPGCPHGGGNDIWVAQRASVDDPWGEPQCLGPNINTPGNETGAVLSPDGHRLYFNALNRPGGFGANDIWVSRRHSKKDDFAWGPAANLGPGVNTSANEARAAYFEDDNTGVVTLYFQSNRLGGLRGNDIYMATLQPDETFGDVMLVTELSSAGDDQQPSIRRDGLEFFLASNRPGTFGDLDLWVSTRASTSDPWSIPVNLGGLVNGSGIDASPALSFDGTQLYFQSTRPGAVGPCPAPGTNNPCIFDLWVTTRAKLTGQD